MYIDCEQDFIKGLDIYQSIVEDLKYDLLNKEEGLPDEKLDIEDIIRDSESLSQLMMMVRKIIVSHPTKN